MENKTEKITADELKKILGCRSLSDQELELISGGLFNAECARACLGFDDGENLKECLQGCLFDF